ncbi:tat pathway signal sequence [Podospora didyma]|uniref:Tat pathway signal sequence n=1 Tax=Podospora didyma TaxID=330526 RepID=A0AAE0U1J8_9PEZI|nr:tat pathway signal sequence [Podospora didyma]
MDSLPSRRSGGQGNGGRTKVWGYEFEWTPEHLTEEQMRPLQFTYDALADKCLDRLDVLQPTLPAIPKSDTGKDGDNTEKGQKQPLSPSACSAPNSTEATGQNDESKTKSSHCNRDLYELLRQHAPEDETLQKLWIEVNTVPGWVNWEQIERGQKVFYRYAGPSIVALTFQSLLGGMGGQRVVETLTRTGGFRGDVARRRLLDTFQHILDITHSIDSVQPVDGATGKEGGKGFASSLRVRLLHASVRRRILQLQTKTPAYYDVDTFGIPISDLDSISTVLAFSATLIWIGFPRQGIFLREAEIADYMALWRWVAHLLGTPTDAFATPSRAKAMMESLMLSEIAPSATSQTLANNIIAGLQNTPPTYASADFLRAEAHWLNGHELADALAIARPPVFYTVLVAGQCLFFMALCYGKRLIPAWDRADIRRLRRRLRTLTLAQTDGKEATFAFQYFPNLRRISTAPAEKKRSTGNKLGNDQSNDDSDSTFWKRLLRKRGVERRNLQAIICASAVTAWMAWFCFKSAPGLLLFQ